MNKQNPEIIDELIKSLKLQRDTIDQNIRTISVKIDSLSDSYTQVLKILEQNQPVQPRKIAPFIDSVNTAFLKEATSQNETLESLRAHMTESRDALDDLIHYYQKHYMIVVENSRNRG